jgi:hypothetical protein
LWLRLLLSLSVWPSAHPHAAGNGIVTDHRLYQLVRQKSAITDHTFVIEFQEPAEAFSFTFG